MATPKFLICDNHEFPEQTYILHTEHPVFLAEINEVDEDEIVKYVEWYEKPEHDVSKLAKLMRELGDFYLAEIDSYEDQED